MKKGFTLIETLFVILLVGVASGAFLLGFAQAQLTLQSIKMKDRAHQELKEYTEEIKSMIASGVATFGPEQPGGKRVTLKASSNGTPLIKGRLNREIRKSSNSGDYSIYYYIRTYITWEKTLYREKNNKQGWHANCDMKQAFVQIS